MPFPKGAFSLSLIEIRNHVRPSGRLWIPAADVYRAGDGWIIKIDLAGVCDDDLEMLLGDSYLIVRGCRRDSVYREGYSCQQMEITYSRFEKRIDFPCAIDGTSLRHDYRDGFLIIHMGCP
jgi:HSP20 family protein